MHRGRPTTPQQHAPQYPWVVSLQMTLRHPRSTRPLTFLSPASSPYPDRTATSDEASRYAPRLSAAFLRDRGIGSHYSHLHSCFVIRHTALLPSHRWLLSFGTPTNAVPTSRLAQQRTSVYCRLTLRACPAHLRPTNPHDLTLPLRHLSPSPSLSLTLSRSSSSLFPRKRGSVTLCTQEGHTKVLSAESLRRVSRSSDPF